MSKDNLIELIKNKSTIQVAEIVVKNPKWLDDPEVDGLLRDRSALLIQILKLVCGKVNKDYCNK